MSDTGHTYALFSALYAPHMGGVESYTAGIARELVAQGNRAIVVTSRLAPEHPENETQADGVEVYRLPCRPLLGARLPWPQRNARHAELLAEVAAAKPDRIVINTRFYEHSHDGARLAAQVRQPAIVIEHGSAHLSLGNALANVAVEAYEHHVTKRIKRFGFPFFGVSEACLTWLRHFDIEGKGVIPNSVDMAEYASAASPRDFRAELGLAEGELLVSCVGRLVPEKGIAAMLAAAEQLDGQGFVFAFAGDGPLLDSVKAAGGRVHAIGRLGRADVAALLRASDAYCLPSRSEGFATTLLEACAMDTFPIVTKVGGVAELGIGKHGGIVLPDMEPASIVEALAYLRQHPEQCAAQGRKLGEHARLQNSWQASARALERAFDCLDSSHCAAAPLGRTPELSHSAADASHRAADASHHTADASHHTSPSKDRA